MRRSILAALLPLAAASAPFAAERARTPAEMAALRAQLESLREQTEIEAEVREADRKELVRPAPKGFKPVAARRKVRVTLVPRETSIRVGESFWYRLELQNIGQEPIEHHEAPSFLKDGLRWDRLQWRFEVLLPDGTRKKMILGRFFEELYMGDRPRRPIDIPGSKKMTEAEARAYARRDSLRRKAQRELHVTLRPGESIASKPWRWVDDEEYLERFKRNEPVLWPAPEGLFRELRTVFNFATPGKYKVMAYLDDPAPEPPSEEFLLKMEQRGVRRKTLLADYKENLYEAFGRVESNWVDVEVKP